MTLCRTLRLPGRWPGTAISAYIPHGHPGPVPALRGQAQMPGTNRTQKRNLRVPHVRVRVAPHLEQGLTFLPWPLKQWGTRVGHVAEAQWSRKEAATTRAAVTEAHRLRASLPELISSWSWRLEAQDQGASRMSVF